MAWCVWNVTADIDAHARWMHMIMRMVTIKWSSPYCGAECSAQYCRFNVDELEMAVYAHL